MNKSKKLTRDEEKALVKKCLSTKPEETQGAWSDFVEQYSNLIYWYIKSAFNAYRKKHDYEHDYAQDNHLVDEVFQKVFNSLFKNDFANLKNFQWKNSCSIVTWLRIVAQSEVARTLEKEAPNRERHDSLDEPRTTKKDGDYTLHDKISSPGPSPYDTACSNESKERLYEAIKRLSPQEQEICELILGEARIKDIAEIMHKSRASIDMQMQRIKKQLGEWLKDEDF